MREIHQRKRWCSLLIKYYTIIEKYKNKSTRFEERMRTKKNYKTNKKKDN